MSIRSADILGSGEWWKIGAPKDEFFYVLDRTTGELLSADPITKVNWTTGIDMKTGRPMINPIARYGTMAVRGLPGPSGGHVWATGRIVRT